MFKNFTLCALLLSLPLLASCAADPIARLNAIRNKRLPVVQQELAAVNLQPGAPVYIRIFKEEGILETWVRNDTAKLYQPFKTYKICAMSGKLGPKMMRGDKQAPEGFYDIIYDRLKPASQYHLAMNIGYPNIYDESHGRTGDLLMIHGGCKSEGCFAMTNPGIEEIYILTEQSLLGGQDYVPVHVFPFRMTEANMARYTNTAWKPFWENLKEGYDYFEYNHVPPVPAVADGRYMFRPQVFVYYGGES
jgi:murein L,D-transpeptidase YafK